MSHQPLEGVIARGLGKYVDTVIYQVSVSFASAWFWQARRAVPQGRPHRVFFETFLFSCMAAILCIQSRLDMMHVFFSQAVLVVIPFMFHAMHVCCWRVWAGLANDDDDVR